MRASLTFVAMTFSFFLGCSPKPATVFKEPEMAYFRGLFRPHGEVGWPTRGMMGKTEREAAAIASFKAHPGEVLPILIRGWEEGFAFPLREEEPGRWPIPPMHEDILHLIICIDPAAAETMLVNKVRSPERAGEVNMPHDMLLSTLFWRLHSKQSMRLFKELMAEDPDKWRFPFVIYCAQVNDPAGLADAKILLRANRGEREPWEDALREAAVCQLEGDVKGMQRMCVRYKDSLGVWHPLWALVFMGRKDLVRELAMSSPVEGQALTVLEADEKRERDNTIPPCNSGPVPGLFEMSVVWRYTPHGPIS